MGGPVTGPAHLRLRLLRAYQLYCPYFGCEGDVIVILPLSMSAVIWVSSDCTLAGTFDAKSWNGAKPVPLFAKVPM